MMSSKRKVVGIGYSTIYQRGKTQVPSAVRKGLEVKDGDRLDWGLLQLDDEILNVVKKAAKVDPVTKLMGKYIP